jgi:hypothetical protein
VATTSSVHSARRPRAKRSHRRRPRKHCHLGIFEERREELRAKKDRSAGRSGQSLKRNAERTTSCRIR